MNRAQRSLWILTAVTILAIGLIAQALAAPAGPAEDILLVLSTLLLVVSAALLIRVIAYLTGTQPVPPRRRGS